MLKLANFIYNLLDNNQKKNFIKIQLLVVIMSILEVVTLSSIPPFISIINDFNLIQENKYFIKLFNFFDLSDPMSFITIYALIILFLVAFNTFFSIFVVWRLSLFAQIIGAEFSIRLFSYYLNQNYYYHLNNNSSLLTKQIATEANRVTGSIIFPLIQLGARLPIVFCISSMLFYFNPIIAIFVLTLLAGSYYLIFISVKKILNKNGNIVSKTTRSRFKLMSEGFNGIKETLLFEIQDFFIRRYKSSSYEYAKSQGTNLAISLVPRYFLEMLAISLIILLILISIVLSPSSDIKNILPLIALYGFAGLKLLPSFQQIYAHITQIRGNIPALESIKLDLINSFNEIENNFFTFKNPIDYFYHCIEIKDLNFSYNDQANLFKLHQINITIPSKGIFAIVGKSGSGKSTLLNIIMGLLEPDTGSLYIDSKKLNKHENFSNYFRLGYIPQKIFLLDASILDNITFGIDRNDIDSNLLQDCINKSKVDEIIESLPNGLNSIVGENGNMLSGGQIQRIGIARALYRKPKILIFDEATNALDSFLQKEIFKTLERLSSELPILIVTHNFNYIHKFEKIFLMNNGFIEDEGSYSDLMNRNKTFQELIKLS